MFLYRLNSILCLMVFASGLTKLLLIFFAPLLNLKVFTHRISSFLVASRSILFQLLEVQSEFISPVAFFSLLWFTYWYSDKKNSILRIMYGLCSCQIHCRYKVWWLKYEWVWLCSSNLLNISYSPYFFFSSKIFSIIRWSPLNTLCLIWFF